MRSDIWSPSIMICRCSPYGKLQLFLFHIFHVYSIVCVGERKYLLKIQKSSNRISSKELFLLQKYYRERE